MSTSAPSLPPVANATFRLLRGRRVIASFSANDEGVGCVRGFFGDGPFLLTATAKESQGDNSSEEQTTTMFPCQGALGRAVVRLNATVGAGVGPFEDPFRTEERAAKVFLTSTFESCLL